MNRPLHPLLEGVGLECREGWFNIIRVLCEQLQDQTDNNKAPQVRVLQVKEKYGALHFHADHYSRAQEAMVNFAEELSRCTCEVCGKNGSLRQLGWIQTLCDEHEAQVIEEFERRLAAQETDKNDSKIAP